MTQHRQLRVFVYGTLKPGGYYWPRFCEGRVTSCLAAKVRGQLFALSVGYPALVHGDGWAHGHLLTLRDEAVLSGFDTLEGYEPGRDPGENEYERIRAEIFDETGESLGEAWAYVMSHERVNALGGVLLASGDWDVDDPDALPALT